MQGKGLYFQNILFHFHCGISKDKITINLTLWPSMASSKESRIGISADLAEEIVIANKTLRKQKQKLKRPKGHGNTDISSRVQGQRA